MACTPAGARFRDRELKGGAVRLYRSHAARGIRAARNRSAATPSCWLPHGSSQIPVHGAGAAANPDETGAPHRDSANGHRVLVLGHSHA